MTLKIVIDPFTLLWPAEFEENGQRPVRGGAGFIVDDEAPCEDRFLRDQDHKLREITAAESRQYEARWGQSVKPGKIELPMALAAIAALKNEVPFEPFEITDKIEANAADAAKKAEADALGIPDPEPAGAQWEA